MAHPVEFRSKLKGKIKLVGPTIKRGARIGSGACILLGVVIGKKLLWVLAQ